MKAGQHELGFLLADVSRLMRKQFRAHAGEAGLTLAEARALVRVGRHEGIRQVELAELLEIQPITLVPLLDKLVGAGLVERRADPSDRRAHRLHCTRTAAARLAEIRRIVGAVEKRALAGVSAADQKTMLRVLESLRANLCAP